MKTTILTISLLLVSTMVFAEGYSVGDKAEGFELKNVNGTIIGPKDFPDAKGFVVIFTCNHCPFAIAWEDRIIELDKKYKAKGYPVIAINSNDETIVPDDSYDKMKVRAGEKGFTFPYLRDADHAIADKYGAMRTPHVYVLNKEGDDLVVSYIGAIDNNHKSASAVTETYLSNALDALIAGKKPSPNFTKALGCSIKR